MSSFVAVRALRSAINNGNLPWKSSCQFSTSFSLNSGKKSTTSKNTSETDPGSDEIKIPDPPSFIFKKDTGETTFGPGASKVSEDYKNPEYFQYHRLSYVDMDVVMQKYRLPQPSSLK